MGGRVNCGDYITDKQDQLIEPGQRQLLCRRLEHVGLLSAYLAFFAVKQYNDERYTDG